MIQNTTYKNSTLRYRDEGQGNTIVLLHGFLESLEMWDDFIPALVEKNYRVVAIDLPGHGGSGVFGETHSMEDMAEAVNTVLEKAGIEKCMMTGHSMGGYVTLAFAEKFEHKLTGICLFHSSSYADSDDKKADRSRAIEAAKNNHLDFISGLIPNLFTPANRTAMKDQVEKFVALGRKTPKEGVTAALAGMRDRKDRSDILRKTKKPVLFILGKEDAILPFDKILSQVFLSYIQMMNVPPLTGHMGFVEAKEETLQTVERFALYCFGLEKAKG